MEEIIDLDYFKQKIEKREKKIKKLEGEIDDLQERAGDYRYEHCKHRKEGKCEYDAPPDDYLDCYDCNQFKQKEE